VEAGSGKMTDGDPERCKERLGKLVKQKPVDKAG
jgi:hypothetical protein